MDDYVTGETIIEALISNMHEGFEPLRSITLVPSLYSVHLHPDDFDRLEPIFQILMREAERALNDEIKKLNKKTGWLAFKPQKTFQAVGPWVIRFNKDMDEDLRKGEILIDSKLGIPQRVELAGSQTLIVKTLRSSTGESKTLGRSYETVDSPQEPTQRVYASISFQDDRGLQSYKMTKPEIVIGRGGKDYHTDLKLYTSPDVSREHLRIRYDSLTNQFYIRDLSTLGTKVNGQAIPSSIAVIDGNKQDRNIEVPIPPRARITLADVLTLEFEASRPR
jgi:pSer/pThr/pTyr-binding forkhead associated (FHA) protein